jgi:zinc protease
VLSEIAKRFVEPQFLRESFECAKAHLVHSYEQWGRNPRALVHRTICAMMYPKLPYNWSFRDAVAYLKCISFDDIERLYQKYFGAHNMVLVLVGNFENAQVKRVIENEFSEITTGKEFAISKDFFQNPHVSDKDIDVPSNLALLALVEPAVITAQSTDFNALKLLDMVNFHGWGSRLSAVREEYGLFYTGFGGFAVEAARVPGFNYLGASFAQDMVERGEALLRAKMRELKISGITYDELMAAKQMLTRKLIDKVATGEAIAQTFTYLASLNLGFDYYDKQLKRVREITLEEVNKVAKKYLNPDNMSRIRIGRFDKKTQKQKQ